MAAISAGPFQEGRRRALLRTLRACGSVAADTELHVKKIWRPDVWAWFTDGARIEIGDVPGADTLERDQRRIVSRARRAGVRVPGRAFARGDPGGRRRDAQSRGETRVRKSGRPAKYAGGFAPDDEADAAFHASQSAERDRSGERCPSTGRRTSTAASSRRDGMLRYLEHFHDPRRRFDGHLPERRSRQGQLPALPDSHRRRPG